MATPHRLRHHAGLSESSSGMYPEPVRKELRRALAAFGRDNHDGELRLDSDLRNARARSADDVAAQLFVRAEGEDPSPIQEFVTELGTLRGC
jgi:hypothetical protein